MFLHEKIWKWNWGYWFGWNVVLFSLNITVLRGQNIAFYTPPDCFIMTVSRWCLWSKEMINSKWMNQLQLTDIDSLSIANFLRLILRRNRIYKFRVDRYYKICKYIATNFSPLSRASPMWHSPVARAKVRKKEREWRRRKREKVACFLYNFSDDNSPFEAHPNYVPFFPLCKNKRKHISFKVTSPARRNV